jgi:acetyl-CoA carboxylase / biotin carboxylase 1
MGRCDHATRRCSDAVGGVRSVHVVCMPRPAAYRALFEDCCKTLIAAIWFFFFMSQLADYVHQRGGARVISRILLANNGLAAVKGIRSLRRWCADTFNDSSALTFVAMVTPEDINSNAEYISLANEVVEVAGEANYNNYANVDVIIECAKRARVHAVWAGWGHASENPELPRKLSQLTPPIQFIGPGCKAMRDLGDKIGSTVLAQSVGVPCVPWSGSGVTCDYSKEGITQEMCDRCCITSLEQARVSAREIGFPLMVKASEGGGGKGIRKVMCEEELEAGFRQVTSEVSGCHVFLMKMATGMRHLEMQVLADEHGEAISLWGRDCSVQRRHQKILEEGPIIAATDDECREMEKCAVRLAKAVGYVGAGTIEFLYGQGQFFFLEMNPRLQVEHPVSEMITGLNIPAIMFLIASGVPLNRISAVTDIFHPDADRRLPPRPTISPLCHCIAARITAENADAGFRPNTGSVTQLKFRSSPDVWGYFSVMGNGSVHEYADSQIGHIFAHGRTREEARRSLILALKELVTRGDIRTTTEYLVWLCNQSRYVDASFDTQWLDGIISLGPKARQERLSIDTPELIVCAGVCYAQLTLKELRKEVVSSLKAGRTPMPNILSRQVDVSLVHGNEKFSLIILETGPRSFVIQGPSLSFNEVEFIELPDRHILIFVNGKSHVCSGVREAQGFRLSISGMTVMFEDEVDPSRLLSSIPGKVARFVVEDGSHVSSGQQYAEIEVMKMYMPVYSTESGILRHFIREGAVVKAGDCIATLDLDDPSRVSKIVPATSVFTFDPPCPPPLGPMQRLRHAALRAKHIVDGYAVPGRNQEQAVIEVIAHFFRCATDPSLSVVAVREALAVSAAILPPDLVSDISGAIDSHLHKIGFNFDMHTCNSESHDLDGDFPAAEFLQRVNELPISNRTAQLRGALEQHTRGWSALPMANFSDLLSSYAEVESKFAGRVDRKDIVVGELLGFEDVVPDSRDSDVGSRNGKSPRLVMEYLLSHERVRTKNFLVLAVVNTINEHRNVFGLSTSTDASSTRLANCLTTISDFQGSIYTDCALACRQLYMKIDLPVHEVRMDRLSAAIRPEVDRITSFEGNWALAENGVDIIGSAGADALELLIHSFPALEDELFEFFLPSQSTHVQVIAAELYIRRSHRVYQIETLSCHTMQLPSALSSATAVCVSWSFSNSNSTAFQQQPVSPKPIVSPLRGLGVRNPSMYFGGNQDSTSPSSMTPLRYGRFVVLPMWSLKAVTAALNALSPDFETNSQDNVVYFALPLGSEQYLGLIEQFSTLLKDSDAELRKQSVSRVTLMLVRDGASPYFFTFSKGNGFNEDTLYRNVDRALAFQLEFSRMTHEYSVQVKQNSIRQIHTYWATNKHPSSGNSGRYFVRSVVLRGGGLSDTLASRHSSDRGVLTLDSLGRANSSVFNEIELALQDSLSALEEVMRKTPANVKAFANHVFLNIIPRISLAVTVALDKIKNVIERCAKRLQDLHAEGVELAAVILDTKGRTHYIRIYSSVRIGVDVEVQAYKCSEIDGVFTLCNFETEFNLPKGPLSGKPVDHPYLPLDSIPRKRLDARLQDTTYCYDVPTMFENAVALAWKRVADKIPKSVQFAAPFTSALELVPEFGDEDSVIKLHCVKDFTPGGNKCGVVGWRILMNTPECMTMNPIVDGWSREIVLIANDITFENGSFGPKESATFKAMSELARSLGIPRIYMAANSGARIGLSRDVMQTFRTKWCDDDDPTRGFEFLYLNAQDEAKISAAGAVRTTKQDGKLKITSVIGEQHGIGVENLRGSGMIAGETSKSYLDNFTLTFVSGHAVGIGAYLVRLGQRVIQKGPDGPPILLTGASALNKLLGRSVYLSNKQLGGVQIMHTNGVSHSIVPDDSAGVEAIVEWLAFVPRTRTEQAPIYLLAPSDSVMPTVIDAVDRKVEWMPPVASPYDSRKLITGDGDINGSGEWISGLVDRGSFVETLSA